MQINSGKISRQPFQLPGKTASSSSSRANSDDPSARGGGWNFSPILTDPSWGPVTTDGSTIAGRPCRHHTNDVGGVSKFATRRRHQHHIYNFASPTLSGFWPNIPSQTKTKKHVWVCGRELRVETANQRLAGWRQCLCVKVVGDSAWSRRGKLDWEVVPRRGKCFACIHRRNFSSGAVRIDRTRAGLCRTLVVHMLACLTFICSACPSPVFPSG